MSTSRSDAPADAVAAALQACLARIESGAAPDAARADQPATVRDEVADLLSAALAVRALPVTPARPAFRARVQGELARIEAETAARRGRTMRWHHRIPRPAGRAGGARGPFDRRPRPAFLLGAVAAAMLLLIGAAYAAAGSRPGDLLYPLRQEVAHLVGFGAGRDEPGSGAGWRQDDRGEGASTPMAGSTPVIRARSGESRTVLRQVPTPPVATSPSMPQLTAPAVVVVLAPATPTEPPTTIATASQIGEAGRGGGQGAEEHRGSADRDRSDRGQIPAPTTAEAPTSTAGPAVTPTETPSTGPVTLYGWVKQDDGAGGRPLVGLSVRLYRAPSPCPPPDLAALLVATTNSDSSGRYELHVPPGTYVVMAEGRSLAGECFPPGWFAAAPVVVTDPCQAQVIDLSGGSSPGVGHNLVYAAGVDTTCP